MQTHKMAIVFIVLLVFTAPNLRGQNKNYSLNLNNIKEGFVTPADSNMLWCYWYWIGDDISKEGISKDFEAMKKAGIGTAFIGNINPDEKDGRVPLFSDYWWECMVHAVNEGKRIGVDIGSFNSPGWSQSGGPWVKSEMAMRYLTYSETQIKGGKNINIQLEKPKAEFQDVRVLAFPIIKAEASQLNKTNATISDKKLRGRASKLIDGDLNTSVKFNSIWHVSLFKSYSLKIKSKEPITARSLMLYHKDSPIRFDVELFARIDNKYKLVKKFSFDRSNPDVSVGCDRSVPMAVSFPETKSDDFKLVFRNVGGRVFPELFEVVISEAAILDNYVEKHLGKMHATPLPEWDSYLWEQQKEEANPALKVMPGACVDLTELMDDKGQLNWDAPAGDWVVQRYGMTPTGTKNSPAAPQGKGYEIDKASTELVQFHFEQYIGELLKRIPEENKDAFKYVIADSYEMGSQNWTDGFAEKFEAQYGYSPLKYLPVYSGRIVGTVDESERFLWDMRRFIADAVAYEYVGGLREISNEHNMKLWLENYGHWGFPSEFLLYGGQSDLVSGEFWNEGSLGDIECKSASSAAHIYGKPVTSAEAFTAAARSYVRHPAMLKKRGDWSFTEGINHFVLHLYIHQPNEDVPGKNAWFSTEFNRHNSWFKQVNGYFEYLRRCQHLLQQGKYVADVCYFIGEDAPIMTGARNPELPNGYSYDYINADVILNRLRVEDGKFVLPDGMSYKLMVLPPFKTMRPELLKKLEQLVAMGGKIYGPAPSTSPSLQNYPQSDAKVKELAEKMWKGSETVKHYGNGLLMDGLELQEALNQIKVANDIDLNGQQNVLWTHRTAPGMEIYFITNQSEEEISFTPSFRVSAMKPQLWNAMSGEVRELHDYRTEKGRTVVPLKMAALQSWFVVFVYEDQQLAKSKEQPENFPDYETILSLDGPWQVDFENKEFGPNKQLVFKSLKDWTKSCNKKIKYYSGTAKYTTTFEYQQVENTDDIIIDLGKVGVMASAKLNGKPIGNTWIAPFRLNIKEAIQEGENTLEVEVVNVWRNRLTGDKRNKKSRITNEILDQHSKKERLISSGLMGPVSIKVIESK